MISANNVTLRIGKKALFEDVNIKFTEGNCYGLIGANGAGKSTFLKILTGQIEPSKGDVSITPGQRLSFLEQDHFKYDEYTVLDTVIMGNTRLYEIMKEKEAIYAKEDFTEEDGNKASELEAEFADMNGWEAESDAAQLLNGLGITTDLHYKLMSELNGSEKVKVLLAKALFGNPDILLLDEPTNHLDLDAIAWLEEFLINFDNTVIVVSHDRYFVKKVATQLLVFEDGTTNLYQFGYEQYQEKLDREASESKNVYRGNAIFGGAISQNGSSQTGGSQTGSDANRSTSQTGAAGNVGESTNANSAAQAGGMAVSSTGKAYYNPGKERSKIQKKVKKAEEDLAVKEAKLDELKAELMKPEYQSSYSKLTEIQNEIDALEEEILIDMEAWEELSSQLEALG